MALTQGSFQEYDFNRMVVLFTMKNDEANVACAISTDAMDQLEGSSRTPPAQREQQFLRLRDRIEARAAGRDPARDRFPRAALNDRATVSGARSHHPDLRRMPPDIRKLVSASSRESRCRWSCRRFPWRPCCRARP